MLTFLRQFFRDARNTGSIMPSSPALARAMVHGVATGAPQRWLEVGPGTGPFTRALLAAKRPGDRLVIVELSKDFCVRLDADILAPWKRANPDQAAEVVLINAPIEDAKLEPGFDHVVCGLPFNNFPPELVERIMVQLRALIRPAGSLRYFAYVGARTLRDGRGALRGAAPLAAIEDRVLAGCARTSDVVMANIPPAKATTVILPS
jgi:phosphatidylethanolamine/phosphatidyl-N-methylethanolamine N-methyltransferase